MKCKCIEKLEKDLKKKFGKDAKFINDSLVYDSDTGKSHREYPLLRFQYHPENKDGTLSKRFLKFFIYHNYCSNCGKSLK